MLGNQTAAAIRGAAYRSATAAEDAVTELSAMRRDVNDALSSCKTAGQAASVAFGAVAIVAVVALLLATVAVVRVPREG